MCINTATYLPIPPAFTVVIVLRVMILTLKQDSQKNRNFHLCLFNHYPYVFCDLLAKSFITFFHKITTNRFTLKTCVVE